MKIIKKIFKIISLIIVTIMFVAFANIFLYQAIISRTLLNHHFYEDIIEESQLSDEVRLLIIEDMVAKAVADYEGTLEEEQFVNYARAALKETFLIHEAKENLNLLAIDYVDYFTMATNGLYLTIRFNDHPLDFRRNLSRSISTDFPDKNHQEIVKVVDEITASVDIPLRLSSQELINDYLKKDYQEIIFEIPNYRDTLMIGIYFGCGFFFLAFFFLSGISMAFRLIGSVIVLSAGANLVYLLMYFENILTELLLKINFSPVLINQLFVISKSNIIPVLSYSIAIGLLLFLFGWILRRDIIKEVKEKFAVTEETNIDVENIEIEELEVAKKEIEFDPFEEKPVNSFENKPSSNELKEEKFSEASFYDGIAEYQEQEAKVNNEGGESNEKDETTN